ncbi:MAG: histone [Candidatus Nanohaloarchaea archaeon]|nr:histone [Candidatus Nanohaloarchaea archaeon]
MELTPAQMRKILEEEGAEEVGDEAAEELAEVLEKYIGYISEEAVAQAREEGRSAVTRADIIAAEE